jgi:hypothetical protein
MKTLGMTAALLVLMIAGQPAAGVDLRKIERRIVREPIYQTGKPRYCLLVFGPQAKTRVWLVLGGKALSADRTGKGDLTGPGKRLKNAIPRNTKLARYHTGPLIATDGKTRYPDVMVFVFETGQANKRVRIDVSLPVGVGATWAHRQRVGGERELRFADRPENAPIVHFDGPLRLALADPKQVFVRGDKPSPLPVVVGTPGLGPASFAAVVFESDAPAAVAQIVFPNREPGGKPIVVEVPLKAPD